MTDSEIENVARAMCRALGINPAEMVTRPTYDTMSPAERISCEDNPETGEIEGEFKRWELYRWHAAMAIAAARSTRLLFG